MTTKKLKQAQRGKTVGDEGAPDPDAYLTREDLLRRYRISASQFNNLRKHEDPQRRFPAPVVLGDATQRWPPSDVDAWEARQQAADIRLRGPIIAEKKPSAKSKAKQQPRRKPTTTRKDKP